MGLVKVLLHGVDLDVVSECFCILRCGSYWVRTKPAVLGSKPSWRNLVFFVPLWSSNEHISLAVLNNATSTRNANMLGKLRFRITSLTPNQQLTADYPLTVDGSTKGSAKMTLEWTYRTVGSLVAGYVKPRFTEELFWLGIHNLCPDLDKEVSAVAMAWLDKQAQPPIPLAISRRALSTRRDNFEFRVTQENWRRISSVASSFQRLASGFERLQRWESPALSILAMAGIVVFVAYPHVVAAVLCAAVALHSLGVGLSQRGAETVVAPAEDSASRPGEPKSADDENALGLRDKYKKMMEFALKIQNILDDIASITERLQALTGWSDPTSSLIFCLLLAARSAGSSAPLLCRTP
uniref:Multiple C2 domain-containing protein n=1 Tax=Tetraselmis sp. GSL018 TaxID=582737 RepID=A0A061RM84_9CHLO